MDAALGDDPAQLKFLVNHYRDKCNIQAARIFDLEGEVALLRQQLAAGPGGLTRSATNASDPYLSSTRATTNKVCVHVRSIRPQKYAEEQCLAGHRAEDAPTVYRGHTRYRKPLWG